MKKIFKIAGFVLLGLVFIGTLGFLYKKSQPESEIYDVKNPEVTTIVKKTVATGSIEPRKEIEVKPRFPELSKSCMSKRGPWFGKGTYWPGLT